MRDWFEHGHGRRPRPGPHRGPHGPRRGRGRPRHGRRASSAPGRARWSSPSGGPKRSTPPSSGRPRLRPGAPVVLAEVEHSAVREASRRCRAGRGRRASTATGRLDARRAWPRRSARLARCGHARRRSCTARLANHEVGTRPAGAPRWSRWPMTTGRCGPRRRLCRRRARALGPRRARGRPGLGQRPQARRAAGDRVPWSCAGACASIPSSSAGTRNGPGGPASRTFPPSSGSPPPRRRWPTGPPRGRGGRRPAPHRCRGREAATGVDGVRQLGATRRPAPARRLLRRRRASRPRGSSSGSTRPASPCTPARRAPRSRSRPPRSSRPWGSTLRGRCGCRSGGRRRTTTSRAFADALPERGRASAGPGRLTTPAPQVRSHTVGRTNRSPHEVTT